MLEKLGSITPRTAWLAAIGGMAVSLAAAVMLPADAQIGAWVRFVIWHGMLNIACAIALGVMAAFAVVHLVAADERAATWARGAQITLLPVWAVGTAIGAVAAKLVWNSWNLTERRMEMSIGYTAFAAVALLVMLIVEDRRVGSWSQIASAAAMGVGLAWISLAPTAGDVHPASAIWSSPDVAFKALAVVIAAALLVAVLALAVLVRRWSLQVEAAEGPAEVAVG